MNNNLLSKKLYDETFSEHLHLKKYSSSVVGLKLLMDYHSGTRLLMSFKASPIGYITPLAWDGFTGCFKDNYPCPSDCYSGPEFKSCPNEIRAFRAIPFIPNQFWLYRDSPATSTIIWVDKLGLFHHFPSYLAVIQYLSSFTPLVVFFYLKKRNKNPTLPILGITMILFMLFSSWESMMPIQENVWKIK